MQLCYAGKKGLGTLDPRGIEVKGVDKMPFGDFKRPHFMPYTTSDYALNKEYPPAIPPEYAA
jgi:hypothetical protein